MAILMRIRGCAAVAAALMATGCDLVREPTVIDSLEHPATVHAILRAGDDTVRVLISRARALNDFDMVPVTGAEVWIHGPSGPVALRETGPGMGPCTGGVPVSPAESPGDAEGAGCYIGVLPTTVRSGERYGLRIRLPSGELVVGETYVPIPPTVSLNSASRLVLRTGPDGWVDPPVVRMMWSRGPDAAALEFDVGLGVAYAGGDVVPGAWCVVSASPYPFLTYLFGRRDPAGEIELRVYGAACEVMPDPTDPGRVETVHWDSVSVTVHVAAADTAYRDYVENRFDNVRPWPRAAAGLEGAVGVFGAVAVTEVPLMIVRENP